MKINILQLIDGARQAEGLTVIIDVFRAFSTACYVVANGAEQIIPVGNIARAFELKQKHPSFLLMGEQGGQKVPGFNYGNSPADIETVDFSGCTVVHRSSAGTQGFANAHGAEEIITGSFCNAGAIIAYIRSRDVDRVSLVCMGQETLSPTDEDTLCAQYLKESLAGKQPNFEAIRTHLRRYKSARKFFDPTKAWAPERDFELCLALSRFSFVLRLEPEEDGYRSLRPVTLP